MPPVALADVERSVRRLRVQSVRREHSLQDTVEAQFRADGIPYQREHKLGPGNVIDFFVPGAGIGVEVKKGKPPSTARVLAQVERYAAFAAVQAVLVVVEGKLHNVPAETSGGKTMRCVNLAKEWGVAL